MYWAIKDQVCDVNIDLKQVFNGASSSCVDDDQSILGSSTCGHSDRQVQHNTPPHCARWGHTAYPVQLFQNEMELVWEYQMHDFTCFTKDVIF